MTNTSNRKRQPKGAPASTGGEFAGNSHDETGSLPVATESEQDRFDRDYEETLAVIEKHGLDAYVTSGKTLYGVTDVFLGRTDEGERVYGDLRITVPNNRKTVRSVNDPREEVREPVEISFTHHTYEKGARTPCSGGAGMEDVSRITRSNGASLEDLQALWVMSRSHHLNTLKPGTTAQMEALDAVAPSRKSYDESLRHLESVGLREDRGYKYGAAWLAQSVPAEDIDRAITTLQGKK